MVAAVPAAALVIAAFAAAQTTPSSLPLGDGHVSTTSAARGSVYLCNRDPSAGGGVQVSEPWIHGSTWDPAAKPAVSGRVLWPAARISITKVNGRLHVVGNGLPKGVATGVFPIQPGTNAYAYDRNPNAISAQRIDWTLPVAKVAARPSCLSGGPIGITVDGVPFFDALDALDRDAAAHELQDACGGHPQQQGMYHYHTASPCLPQSGLIGYALDGFPIYGPRAPNGTLYTNAQLDACHGHVVNGQYRYQATLEYPYTLGCFKGIPLRLAPPP